jgi:branched-chain amino acid transport system ATP-binding protein
MLQTADQHAARGLEVKDVTVRFQGLAAIEDVSECLRPGEILGLIGPNGAGKTTLVNVMTGFQAADSGSVRLDGRQAYTTRPGALRRAGVARSFQAGRLFPSMSVRENVEVAAVNTGLARRAARAQADALLDWIGLAGRGDLAASVLPYTDERRVGIARALAGTPSYVLLDEPAAGMSDLECERMMELIRTIPDRFGSGVMLIEHNMSLVMGVCARIHVLDSGRTIARGTPAEIRRDPAVIKAYLGQG